MRNRTDRSTMPVPAMPPANHPIWKLGHAHVRAAMALVDAFAVFSRTAVTR